MRFPKLMPLQKLVPLLMVGGVLAFSFALPSNHITVASTSVGYGYGGGCHKGHGEGDVDNHHGGKAHVKVDEDKCDGHDQEDVQENDSGDPPGDPPALAQTGRFALRPAQAVTVATGDTFQSTAFTSVTFDAGLSTLTIVGTGTHNGSPVTFTMVAVNGPAGVGAFHLTLSDLYAVGGVLLDGAITLQ